MTPACCTGGGDIGGSAFVGDAKEAPLVTGDVTADLVTGGGEWTAGSGDEKLLLAAVAAAAWAAAVVPGLNVGVFNPEMKLVGKMYIIY